MRRLIPWLAVWGLTLALTAVSAEQSLRCYREFRSGWQWDLAYYNQWTWALVFGDGTITARPVNAWGDEGRSIWVRTHLDPICLVVVPFYRLWPGPETLIVSQNVILWWVLPAAFGLLLSESRSTAVALSGAAMVPMTPLLWPMLWNDFRGVEFGLPFVIWAIHGFRSRHRGLSAFGIIGMLACREEYALILGTFALLPPRDREDIGTTFAWARTVAYLGAGWFLFAFFGFQHLVVVRNIPEVYLSQFGGPGPGLGATAEAALDLLVFGLGAWAFLAALAPRAALLVLPWTWALVRGRWVLESLSGWRWGSVRYAAPVLALGLAAGLIGYARLGVRLLGLRRGKWALGGAWLAMVLGFWVANREIAERMSHIPWDISSTEAAEIRRWVARVGPDDAVLSSYEVAAPLSSRRHLYSNRLRLTDPPGYPDHLEPDLRWAFLRKVDHAGGFLTAQGFRLVHRGDFLEIYRRDDPESRP